MKLEMLKEKLKQYKNLILVSLMIVLLLWLLIGDPVGYFVERRHLRAQIQNQIAIERAETEKQIAIINAEMVAEQTRIRENAGISISVIEVEANDTPDIDLQKEQPAED